jgi:hypothetical protein
MFRQLLVAIGLLSCAGGVWAQEPDDNPMRQFESRVAAYVALHRSVERSVPTPRVFTDSAEAEKMFRAMTQAMQAMRASVNEGDVFIAEAAPEFRRRIGDALLAANADLQDLLAEMRDTTLPGARPPVVNETFSWALGNLMPPQVLMALPPLPDELEYRFVGRDLVLIDVHANLVVDVLREALPAETWRDTRRD